MNRTILIGNGFDLAHDMKTTYQNFLDDYWGNLIEDLKRVQSGRNYEDEEIKIKSVPSHLLSGSSYKDLNQTLESYKSNIEFKNNFLREITDRSHLENWVDVENEYYLLLIQAFKSNEKIRSQYNNKIQDLNEDFGRIKELLQDYLKRQEQVFDTEFKRKSHRIENVIGHKIYSEFEMRDFSEESINRKAEVEYNWIKKDLESIDNGFVAIQELDEKKQRLINRIDKKKPLNAIKSLLKNDIASNYFDLSPSKILFLNFNYTFTDSLYHNYQKFDSFNRNPPRPEFLHIHGSIDPNDKNPMIFGFGDELDEDYKEIEKLNDNRYLENIKSINYLGTDNYRNLLNFINSENYQVFIFGHSCGTSDRTLLNTLFEHDNCASIKIFFHQKSDVLDNYRDLIQNISRNFNDKAKMRDRVVNKTYCDPLS